MKYNGKYEVIDLGKIKTYPVSKRKNKVTLANLVNIQKINDEKIEIDEVTEAAIEKVAQLFYDNANSGKTIAVIAGAHLVKNGLSPIIIDLMKRELISVYATNTAAAIHDFELGLIGQTSEDVPNALPEGNFGMAYELGYINQAMNYGNRMMLGLGESLGRMIVDKGYRSEALKGYCNEEVNFNYPEKSILGTGYRQNIPVTIHSTLGNDVTDQHPNFDGEAKGGTSGRDFLIFTQIMKKLVNGGLILNIGSAIIGPELLLKALSITANLGYKPEKIHTADFDIRPSNLGMMKSEDSFYYYFRDQKSIVTRIPQSFNGEGFYICGNHMLTIKRFYQLLTKKFGW
jgi:hypothetical protein